MQENGESPALIVFRVSKIIATTIGLLANVLTLATLILNGKSFPKISRILLKHQAITDGVVCIMGIGIYCGQWNLMWMTGNATLDFFICQAWHGQAMYWGVVVVSVWNLVLIAFERFLMINYPEKHQNMQTTHIYIIFALVYICSSIILIPAYIQVKYDSNTGKCLNEYYFKNDTSANVFHKLMGYYAISWFLVVYAIPIIIFVVFYAKAILTLQEGQKYLGESNQRSRTLDKANQQLTRTGIAVTIVFILFLSWDSWFFLLHFAGIVAYEFNSHLQVVGVFLANFNSCVNPFIYSASLSIFRKSLQKTLRWRNAHIEGQAKAIDHSIMSTPSNFETVKLTKDGMTIT